MFPVYVPHYLAFMLFSHFSKNRCPFSPKHIRPKKENVLFPVTLPTLIFGAYSNVFEDFQDIRLFLRIFILYPYKKVFIKKVCLPTNPKKFCHVTGNKTYFSFGLMINAFCQREINVTVTLIFSREVS